MAALDTFERFGKNDAVPIVPSNASSELGRANLFIEEWSASVMPEVQDLNETSTETLQSTAP